MKIMEVDHTLTPVSKGLSQKNRGNNMADVSGHASRVDLHIISMKGIIQNIQNCTFHDSPFSLDALASQVSASMPAGSLQCPTH